MRTLLLQTREEAQLEVDSLNAQAEEMLVDRQSVEYGDDNMDVGSDLDREQKKELAERSIEKMREIADALIRVDEGTYGRCDDCYEAIPKDRLLSQIPVFLCVDCRRQRWY
jgi:DnaK suppressor protein